MLSGNDTGIVRHFHNCTKSHSSNFSRISLCESVLFKQLPSSSAEGKNVDSSNVFTIATDIPSSKSSKASSLLLSLFSLNLFLNDAGFTSRALYDIFSDMPESPCPAILAIDSLT